MTLLVGIPVLILQVSVFLSLSHPIRDSPSAKIEQPKELNSKLQYAEYEKQHNLESKQLERNEESSNQQLSPKKQGDAENSNYQIIVKDKRQAAEKRLTQGDELFYNPDNGEENYKNTLFSGIRLGSDQNSDHAIADDLRGSNTRTASNNRKLKRKLIEDQDDLSRQDLQSGSREELCQEGKNTVGEITKGQMPKLDILENMQNLNLKDDDLIRQERHGSDLQDVAEVHEISPETIETLKKINPLTIGDQVSQRMRNRNSNSKNKPLCKSADRNCPGMLQDVDQVVDSSSSCSQENDEVLKKQPPYEKQQPPTIVHKPCSNNDYGFSVIILAGDPIKIGGHGAAGTHCQTAVKCGNGKENPKQSCGIDDKCTNDEEYKKLGYNGRKNAEFNVDRALKKEIRIPKTFSNKAEFPIYDEDLPFVPDPFHGLLDSDYWHKNRYSTIEHLNFEPELNLSPHNIKIRENYKGSTPDGDDKAPTTYQEGSANREVDGYEKHHTNVSCSSYGSMDNDNDNSPNSPGGQINTMNETIAAI